MTEIRESTDELCKFVLATRQDWGEIETRNAILAARTAGLDWPRIVRRLVDIALEVDPVPGRPGDLWAAVRGITSAHVAGAPFDPEVKDALFAQLKAAADRSRLRATGGQPALRESDDP